MLPCKLSIPQAVPSLPLRARAHKLTMIDLEEWRAYMGAWHAVKGRWFGKIVPQHAKLGSALAL